MSSEQDDRRGISMRIDYNRISPDDGSGMVDIECLGSENWLYACVGTHYGIQSELDEDDEGERRIREFGSKLATLVREFFGEVPPILDRSLKRKEPQ